MILHERGTDRAPGIHVLETGSVRELRGTVQTFLAVFVTLKLTELIDWNWVWVVSPVWGFACLLTADLLVYAASLYIERWRRNQKP